MKSATQHKTAILTVLATVALACLGLLPQIRAVTPPPDGCYPGFTTAEGCNALKFLSTGAGNTGVGWYSLYLVGGGNYNTGVGAGTLVLNTADSNTAVGAAALLLNTTGTRNTAVGTDALVYNDSGVSNTAVGLSALGANTTGSGNIAIGNGALGSNTGGGQYLAIGFVAGVNLTTGNFNIDINNLGVAGESGTIRIGTADQTATYLAGIAGQTVGAGGSTCYVDNAGKLGVFLSARRYKTDITDMGAASEAILALRPITFHYKPELDKTGIPQFGLIAEDVAKVNPDLVTHDAKGDIYTVRYEAVNAMLLNEFLKEHRKNEEQQRQIDILTAQLKEQAAQIQKVSAQLEASKPAARVVLNSP